VNYNARTREQLFLLLLVISVEEMSITSVRERLSVNAMSRDLQTYSSGTAGPTSTTLGMCILYWSWNTSSTKQNFQFRHMRPAAPRPQVNPAAFAHSVYTQ